ncbi:MAG: hypothetical protein IMZ65_00760 [Planctomycetes bacterium]|nr:hypothetical protein [Planctomycetota bacterium]
MAPTAEGNVRQWLRLYSERLDNSYRASAIVQHNVTKGGMREGQILDLLGELLPKWAAVERNVVIADCQDVQSPKFDAVLLDRLYWPRLFQQDDTAVVMLESVLAAIEVKSSLSTHEIKDVFQKSAALRGMKCAGKGSGPCPPVVAAFAYACANLPLAFFDFACEYTLAPALSPTIICVLNGGLFFLCRRDGRNVVPEEVPSAGLIPAVLQGPDALFVFVHALSSWASGGGDSVEVYRAYGREVFVAAKVFYFDEDYLPAVVKNSDVQQAAREAYLRPGKATFDELYKASRRSIGLSERVSR